VLVLYKETNDEEGGLRKEEYNGKIDSILGRASLRVNPSMD
jgi:hypothetical protein